jgi:hypothetical protein
MLFSEKKRYKKTRLFSQGKSLLIAKKGRFVQKYSFFLSNYCISLFPFMGFNGIYRKHNAFVEKRSEKRIV